MVKDYPGERWRNVEFNFEHINDMRLEVSNFGRVRSFNKISNGNILKGSMINGYRIIRLKFYKPKDEKRQQEINDLRLQINLLSKHLKSLEYQPLIESTNIELADLKKNLARKVKADDKKRKIYYHSLVHRFVANYFLPPPSADQTVVTHLDYNKLNNRSYNLKWMTAEENYAHQKQNPQLLAEKNDPTFRRKVGPTTKLSVTKVMLLKKLLNQNKPVRLLAKQFRITDTQVIRIKKGVNWADIDAAK